MRKLRCSFCKKNEDEVAKLVAGPRVYICDNCIAIAKRIMDDDSPRSAENGSASGGQLLIGYYIRLQAGISDRVSCRTLSGD